MFLIRQRVEMACDVCGMAPDHFVDVEVIKVFLQARNFGWHVEETRSTRSICRQSCDRSRESTSGTVLLRHRYHVRFEMDEGRYMREITVIIVQPRLVRLQYGTVEVTKADLKWLSRQINSSILGVIQSQQGNLRHDDYRFDLPDSEEAKP